MQKPKLLKFSKRELRWDFYPMFFRLIKKGCKIEAFLLMLSTWNFACFRYAVRGFNIDRFIKAIKNIESMLKRLRREDFKTINFDKYSKETKKTFKILVDIKGIQKTGAPKIMHLMAPRVFVMWDAYIRNYYGFKKGDADDYLAFLKLMQKQFPNVQTSLGRTITKLIDEHNYITITEPALKKNKLKIQKSRKIN